MADTKDYGLSWTEYILYLNPKERTQLKNAVLDAIEEFDAKWVKKVGSASKVAEKKAEMKRFVKFLRSPEVKFTGFGPIHRYIKASKNKNDPKEDLQVQFNHPWGIPTLHFKLKNYPGILSVNPSMYLDDSVINKIDSNSHLKIQLEGYSG